MPHKFYCLVLLVLLLPCIICSDLSSLSSWEFHIDGEIELTSVVEHGEFLSAIGNYKGYLTADDPLFYVEPSISGNTKVSSGIILLFKIEEDKIPQLQWVSSINSNYHSVDLFLQKVEIYNSYIICTGSTETSAITLHSNKTSEDKSIVVGSIGNFITMLDNTGGKKKATFIL